MRPVMAKLFIPKEVAKGERRVAAVPETIKKYVKAGIECVVEAGAGELANVTDANYREAGATIASDATQAWSEADIVMKVAAPTVEQAGQLKEGSLLISFIAPHKNLDLVRTLVDRKVSCIAMELIPRTTKAQTMDALSSQANIAGYKAVLLAAWKLGTYFPLLMTAAGTIKPARVVIMGAGVAGLQAIATAKRLGAIVEVSDIRPVVEEQVKSLGGRFIPLPDMGESGEGTGGYAKEMTPEFLAKQREIVAEHVREADVVICTALVPGKKAPVLVTEDMVKSMKKGAVVVDLAVEAGGNCPLSKMDEEIEVHGVQILGWSNLASTAASDASLVYSRNLDSLLMNMFKEGSVFYDLEEEVTAGSLLTHQGVVRHEPTAQLMKGDSAS
jgi:H+-translocating NAD(P) transhydrogenase subunit alpha